LYLCGMLRQDDQERAHLLSDTIRTGNGRIRAPTHRRAGAMKNAVPTRT
jgi:hypothetical protein